MALYRDLFLNGMNSLLAGNFPMLREILGATAWRTLVEDFYREHRCRTPLFTRIGNEFLDWLQTRPPQPPFLHELAHYEWIELALLLDEAEAMPPGINPDGDLLEGIPVASPLAWPLAYQFPVHRISPAFQPQTAPGSPTFLLIRRDADDTVHFHEIDALTHGLMQALHEQESAITGQTLIENLTGNEADHTTLRALAIERLHELHLRGTICGTRAG